MRNGLAAAALVAIVGCQTADHPPANGSGSGSAVVAIASGSGRATVAAAAAAIAPTPTPPTATDLELLDPGREPRAPLRYHVSAGTHAKLVIAAGAEVMGEALPTMSITAEVTIERVADNGDMQLRMTVTDLSAHDDRKDGAAAMLAAQLAAIKSLTMTAVLTPSGALHELAIALGDPNTPLADQLHSVTDNFAHLAMPLPTAPVGVGARWRSVRAVDQGGFATTVTTTITLTAIDGDRMSYSVASQVDGPRQTLAEGGLTVIADKLAGTGGGDGTIDLGTFAITGSQTTAFTAEMTADGQALPMDAKMKLTITAP